MRQMAMRAPGLSQASLSGAHERSTCDRGDELGLGFDTWTAPSVAPPAPAEFVEAIRGVEQATGDLLEGLVLFSIVCNVQRDGNDGHVPHYDPSAYEAIVGVSLGPGKVTMELLDEQSNVVYEQVLEPGAAYLLVNQAVKRYKHRISEPTDGVRACLPADLPRAVCIVPCRWGDSRSLAHNAEFIIDRSASSFLAATSRRSWRRRLAWTEGAGLWKGVGARGANRTFQKIFLAQMG